MSKRTTKLFILPGVVLALGLLLAACSGATPVSEPTAAPAVEQPVAPTCPAPVPCPTAVPVEPGIEAPYEQEWSASPHNAADTEPFMHWNEEDPAEIPTYCAKCHSTTGYVDFLGGDGSEAGKVDAAVAVGETITCDACHSQAAQSLTSVTFPSGAVINGLGAEARCLACHQGLASKVSVDAQIEKFTATDPDKVVEPLKDGDKTVSFAFVNIHYSAAGATLFGSEALGGYQYDGKGYDIKFEHVEQFDTCVECHSPHTTEVRVDKCAMCHEGVASVEDLRQIRMEASASDYDGDGDVKEPIKDELDGVRGMLYGAIQVYAKEVAGKGIVYDEQIYPYWLVDADGDGEPDKGDNGPMAYDAFTPRLLKATYNYHVSVKDPGAYAHGNKYIIQLLYDSTADVNDALKTKIDMSRMRREDSGHFAGDSDPFRHWDADEMTVPGSCAKCHTATGLPQFIKEGANISNPVSNGFLCSTCHDESNFPAVWTMDTVTFPSGATASFGEGAPDNLCIACHQGLESGLSVTRKVGDTPGDTVDEKLSFINVHYAAAGATLFGSQTQGAYEYPGKEYAGQFAHVANLDTCAACHDKHALEPNLTSCQGCHGTEDPAAIRMKSTADYDGDGDASEGLKGEYDGVADKLYEAILVYAQAKSAGVIYNPAIYPYWFADADNDGEIDKGEDGRNVGYKGFTPKMLKAAYNLHYSKKDTGGYVHNFTYVVQAMYDSIQDLGAPVTGMTRP